MEKTPKMKICKHCGAEIAAGAKTCPKCGGKNKKVIYKRPWFIFLAVIVVIGIIGGIGGSDNTGSTSDSTVSEQEEKIEYKKCDIGEMVRDLEENASRASDKYKNQYIEVTGRISQIDSDGAYIDLIDAADEMSVAMGDLASDIKCRTGYDDELISKIKELKKEENVTVRGKITDVGEYMKYDLTIDEIIEK